MAQATDEKSQQEGLAGQASAKVQDAASVAQEKTSELRDQGSARLREQFDQRSTEVGGQARSLAEALRRSGSDLRSEGNGGAAQLTGQAADRIDRLGSYLEQKSGDEVMRDIETFARRRPWLLAGVGMLTGVAVARFMKASSEQRYGDFRRGSQQWPAKPQVPGSPSTGTYGQTELSSASGARTNDPPARDPYAGAR